VSGFDAPQGPALFTRAELAYARKSMSPKTKHMSTPQQHPFSPPLGDQESRDRTASILHSQRAAK